MQPSRFRRPNVLSVLVPALLSSGCVVRPTPDMIANCRNRAAVMLAPAAKTRSIHFSDPGTNYLACAECMRVLREWRLDFIELPMREAAGLVDRIGLAPRGSPSCAPPPQTDRGYWPDAYRLKAPRGMCLTIERRQNPRAQTRVAMTRVPMTDHGAEIFEAVPAGGGAPLIRITDFTIRAADARPALCADVRADFPRAPLRLLLAHIAERR